MSIAPIEILQIALEEVKHLTAFEPREVPKSMAKSCSEDLSTIVRFADQQKAVLGVILTSIVYKIYRPDQDIRLHQEGMQNGYSGRSFDTKYTTPFLKNHFPHFAMAESSWLTRSLEQPQPFNLDFPGKIRNQNLKTAFLSALDYLQNNPNQATNMLHFLLGLLFDLTQNDDVLFEPITTNYLTIARMVDAVSQHIRYNYGIAGTARIPVLAIYAVYRLLLPDIKRYDKKILAPLESHTSPDSRSKALGDIDILNSDLSQFEAVEIKHNKPISVDMIDTAYRKIRTTSIDRYYILTTSEPNFDNYQAVLERIEKYKQQHDCQIIVNGVIPSLKYYLRLISDPQKFIDEYTNCLESEFKRASGIKKDHLINWQRIRQEVLNLED
jgi:DNA (cytosine-5)-methyltransferase 1